MPTMELRGAIVYLPPFPGEYDVSDVSFEPGTSVRVTAGPGFSVTFPRKGIARVRAHWWRVVKHHFTGKW